MANNESPEVRLSATEFEQAMLPLFADNTFTESDFDRISFLLTRRGNVGWKYRPRTYAVLRMIDRIDLMDEFVVHGLKDIAFPYTLRRLPQELIDSPSDASNFLEKQAHILTNAKEVEVAHEDGSRHQYFEQDAAVHFSVLRELGRGGYGVVHHVRSKLSGREFARKIISRKRTILGDQKAISNFEEELSTLKRLSHHHLVKFQGSYTDQNCVGLLMSPVADCNLKEFLALPHFTKQDLQLLRPFYGCLCSAVCYLHESRIRHKDIKPENILVFKNSVLISDFGTARDFSDQTRSTSGPPGARTALYAAPEVLSYGRRGLETDIWSLGCVFLDMTTVLNGRTLNDKSDFFAAHGTADKIPAINLSGLNLWLNQCLVKDQEQKPTEWAVSMLQQDKGARPEAAALMEQIWSWAQPYRYYGSCCAPIDEVAEEISPQDSGHESEKVENPKSINPEKIPHPDLNIDSLDIMANLSQKMETLGPNHPSTLNTTAHLGYLYLGKGFRALAATEFERAGEGYHRIFGEDHPLTLHAMYNLGRAYIGDGRWAGDVYHRLLIGCEKTFGPDHPATLDAIHDLGQVYAEWGQWSEAKALLEQALAGYEKAFGQVHPRTLNTLYGLGRVHAKEGDATRANEMFHHVLAQYRIMLDRDSSAVVDTILDLSQIYEGQSWWADFKIMFDRVMIEHENTGNTVNPPSANTFHNQSKAAIRNSELEDIFARAFQEQREKPDAPLACRPS